MVYQDGKARVEFNKHELKKHVRPSTKFDPHAKQQTKIKICIL
jgi:hypothetical protein